LLRGLIDAGDYNQLIFALMFFKRLYDLYDVERGRACQNTRQGDAQGRIYI
jgi:hypothetical protein